jgi:D-inositol-3-phosphate glycosyltransferase
MMMELPVVATDAGAVCELVEDGRTGFVVPPLDEQAFAGAMLRILGDDAVRASFGRRGRARAIERFSADQCARLHLEAYEYVLRNRRFRRTASGAVG